MIGTLRMYVGFACVATLPIGLFIPMSYESMAVAFCLGVGGFWLGTWGVTAREIHAARLEAAQKAQVEEFERYWTEWGTRADQERLADATEKLCNPKPIYVGMHDEFGCFTVVRA
jgi:hypothetical protein